MSGEKTVVHVVDPEGRWLYRAGGISALAIGAAYIITIPLYVEAGVPPSDAEAWLKYLAGKTTVWWAILGLSVLTDVLFIPVVLSVYLALKGTNRNAMLVASAFVGLFVVLDLAVTWPNYASLITLSGKYAAATNGAQRATYVAAANYASAVLASRLEAVYSILVLSLGILLIGFVMLKGRFGKSSAYLGMATGFLGIVAVASAFGLIIILASVLTTIWVLFVGYRLYRLGQASTFSAIALT
jgi:hypothetical protein